MMHSEMCMTLHAEANATVDGRRTSVWDHVIHGLLPSYRSEGGTEASRSRRTSRVAAYAPSSHIQVAVSNGCLIRRWRCSGIGLTTITLLIASTNNFSAPQCQCLNAVSIYTSAEEQLLLAVTQVCSSGVLKVFVHNLAQTLLDIWRRIEILVQLIRALLLLLEGSHRVVCFNALFRVIRLSVKKLLQFIRGYPSRRSRPD